LNAPARQLLAEIAAEHGDRRGLPEFVFPGNGGHTHQREIKRAWQTICRRAEISGLRVHDLRHSFASQLASGGASLLLIGAMLGHSQPRTTARYAHIFDSPLRQATEKVGAVYAAADQAAPPPEPVPFKRPR
jgi:site-specific recombinase XerD